MRRLTSREASAIVFYRVKMHLSINQISELLERSTRTVHNVISKNSWLHKQFDKRHYPPGTRARGVRWFLRRVGKLSWFLELWKEGVIGNILLLSGRTADGEPP